MPILIKEFLINFLFIDFLSKVSPKESFVREKMLQEVMDLSTIPGRTVRAG